MTYLSVEGREDLGVLAIYGAPPVQYIRVYKNGTVATGPTPLPVKAP